MSYTDFQVAKRIVETLKPTKEQLIFMLFFTSDTQELRRLHGLYGEQFSEYTARINSTDGTLPQDNESIKAP